MDGLARQLLVVARSPSGTPERFGMATIVENVLEISKTIFDIDAEVGEKREGMAKTQAEAYALLKKAQAEIDALLKARAKHVTSLEVLLVSSTSNLTQPDRVLRFLKQNEDNMYSADDLSEELDINVNSVRAVLSQLRADGEIDSPERGFYTYNPPTPTPPASVPPASGFRVVDFAAPAEDAIEEEDD